ncbi:MAG: sigma-70 family RNA polymerase sigma factor [Proteobacteria bacterium]|nr:sigma-70 family RNA polymerase sigma factor [Pseudomonadota bacterium]MCP4921459.1 sigma-70 family RNA polymerase sigma factor [Pseudomonadota bacterium]
MRYRPGVTTQAELVRRVAIERDRAAFAELFQLFAPRVNAWLRKRGASAGQAEEVTQDVLLFVWHKAEKFDPSRASVGTWIYTIARNKHVDRIRRERRPEAEPEEMPTTPSRPPDADRVAHVAARDRRLREALSTLPEDQAVILRRNYYEDTPQRQIAADLDLPVGTVKSRTRLAFKRLREALEHEITLS